MFILGKHKTILIGASISVVLMMQNYGLADENDTESLTTANTKLLAVNQPSIQYEISEGQITLIFQKLYPSEITDISWNGKSIYKDIIASGDSNLEYVGDGFLAHLNQKVKVAGPGLIEVILANGEKLQQSILSGPIPALDWLAAASCSTAPAINNAVQCDSTKSSVGTPPYPCCDNNNNKKATDSGDGNCTWYAWYKAKKVKGWTVPSNWGGGGSWCANASKTSGWKVSSTPTVDTIACSSSLGHVAWVVSVSSDKKKITVEEQNCKVSPYCVGTGTRTNSYSASSFQYISKK